MATVPQVNPLSVELNPVRAPAQRAPNEALFTAQGEQQVETGNALMRSGNVMGAVANKELEKINDARMHEKYSILSKAMNESIYGEKGVMTLQGSQAVGAADKWTGEFDRISSEVTKDLNPAQRQAFERYRLSLQTGGYSTVMRHEAGQAKVYQDASYKNLVTTSLETAGLNYTDTPMVGMQTEIALEAMRKRPEYVGASADVKATMEKGLRGSFHAQVIESALTAKNTAFANQYFEQAKGEMPLDLKNKVEARLRPATDFEDGRALALEVQDKIKKGELTLSDAETYMIGKAKSKDALGVAQSVMREVQDAQKRDAARQSGTLVEKFERAPTRATFNSILGSPEFQKMEPEVRANLTKYFRSELEQADDRFRARRNEKFQSPEAFSKFQETLDDPRFASMERGEIFALQTTIGPALTGKLLAEQKALKGGAQRFQIDKDLLNEAIPKSLLATSNKDKLNAFRGIVESNLAEWKSKNPGKVPTLEEQKQIASSANAEYVSVGLFWDSKKPAYEAVSDVSAVPKNFYNEAKAWAAKSGKTVTDKDILQMWTKQQEKTKGAK